MKLGIIKNRKQEPPAEWEMFLSILQASSGRRRVRSRQIGPIREQAKVGNET